MQRAEEKAATARDRARATRVPTAAVLVLACVMCGAPSWAEEHDAPGAEKEAAQAEDKAEALALLKGMSDFLGGQRSFRYVAVQGYDSVQVTGQKLEFGQASVVTLRRPDRLRFELLRRDGEVRNLFYDGERISMSFPARDAYASVLREGGLESALDFITNDLDTPVPLAELLRADLYAQVSDGVDYGFVVGDARIVTHDCTHVAFARDGGVDVQVWIQKGPQPLPRRIVFTYDDEPGAPQFWSQFLEWELGVEAPDALFEFTPPEGYERLDFAVRAAPAAEEAP